MSPDQTLDYYSARLHRVSQEMNKCIEHTMETADITESLGFSLEALSQHADQIKAIAVMLRLEMQA